jgi:hypothetical protein
MKKWWILRDICAKIKDINKKTLLRAVNQKSGTQDAYQKEALEKISKALEIIQ